MIHNFVGMLMASGQATPGQPLTAFLTNVSGNVRVNWTNAGAFQTKIYRKTPFSASTWALVMGTVAAGVVIFDPSDAVTDNQTYGVSHVSGGLESTIRTCTPITPAQPAAAGITLY